MNQPITNRLFAGIANDAEAVEFLKALLDLVASTEVDNTADEDEDEHSWPVIGNVSTSTLRTLGFDIPE